MFARILLLALTSLLAIGCSDSDDDDDLNVTGVWRGPLVLRENSCAGVSPVATFDAVHTVIRRDGDVALDDQDGLRYIGNTVGGDGFSVDAAGSNLTPIGDGGRCDFTLRIEYKDINDDDDLTAAVEQFFEGSCDNASCVVRYEGAMLRTLDRN